MTSGSATWARRSATPSPSTRPAAVFIVSNGALYRFRARDGKPAVTWRRAYDNGDRTKPGQTQAGSGTTPTIIRRGGRKFVAITDNADPRMHVLVFRAGRERARRRPVCRMPVFAQAARQPPTTR